MGIWTAIKHAMNSTLGTSEFSPLDKIIKNGLSDVDTNVIRLRGGVQTFTANGTFTVPAGVTKILVTACAGGQAGEYNGKASGTAVGGAGGDWIYREPYAVTAGQVIAITVGKGGSGSLGVGGSTVIGSLVTLSCPGIRGGQGGADRTSYSAENNGGNGFAAGGIGIAEEGGGGGSLGRGGSNNKYGVAKGQLGGGGAGQTYVSGHAYANKGGDGIVIIEW